VDIPAEVGGFPDPGELYGAFSTAIARIVFFFAEYVDRWYENNPVQDARGAAGTEPNRGPVDPGGRATTRHNTDRVGVRRTVPSAEQRGRRNWTVFIDADAEGSAAAVRLTSGTRSISATAKRATMHSPEPDISRHGVRSHFRRDAAESEEHALLSARERDAGGTRGVWPLSNREIAERLHVNRRHRPRNTLTRAMAKTGCTSRTQLAIADSSTEGRNLSSPSRLLPAPYTQPIPGRPRGDKTVQDSASVGRSRNAMYRPRLRFPVPREMVPGWRHAHF